MIDFSYSISPLLKTAIEEIDKTRDRVLCELIGRKEELQLRWEANISRSTAAGKLSNDLSLQKQGIFDTVHPSKRDKTSNTNASDYPKVLEWINQEWFLNEKKVQPSDVKKIMGFFPTKHALSEAKLQETLNFIQVNPEHGIIQAGLALFLTMQIVSDPYYRIQILLAISYLFLYKYGYDFRGLLSIEELFATDAQHFKYVLEDSTKRKNLSAYLEYFTSIVAIAAEQALKKLKYREFKHTLPSSFYELSERQKEIMMMFSEPGVKISNKTIQKKFNISQITASRDLAKLHALGLIFSAGKGRSVYYTRI